MINDQKYSSESFVNRYQSRFFGIHFYDTSHLSYTAQRISALYKYIHILIFGLTYYKVITLTPSLSKFMQALHKAHIYGYMIDGKLEQNWINLECEKYNFTPSDRITLCFSGALDAKRKQIVSKGFWWVEQSAFIVFMIGFLFNFLALINLSVIHFTDELFSLKTIYLIIFWISYASVISFVSCIMKAHLWDSHQLLKKLKYIERY